MGIIPVRIKAIFRNKKKNKINHIEWTHSKHTFANLEIITDKQKKKHQQQQLLNASLRALQAVIWKTEEHSHWIYSPVNMKKIHRAT